MNFSYEIAKKHVQISERIYRDVADCRSDLKVYLATHSRRGNYYEIAEGDSGLEFWGISLYPTSKPSGGALKLPDGIVADKKRGVVSYVLEIKWGWITDLDRLGESDLSALVKDKGAEERVKIKSAISRGKSCRVGKRKFPKGKEWESHKEDFRITEETKFLLISDFCGMMKRYPEDCSMLVENLDRLIPGIIRLDYKQTYNSDFGAIQSFRDYISSP